MLPQAIGNFYPKVSGISRFFTPRCRECVTLSNREFSWPLPQAIGKIPSRFSPTEPVLICAALKWLSPLFFPSADAITRLLRRPSAAPQFVKNRFKNPRFLPCLGRAGLFGGLNHVAGELIILGAAKSCRIGLSRHRSRFVGCVPCSWCLPGLLWRPARVWAVLELPVE